MTPGPLTPEPVNGEPRPCAFPLPTRGGDMTALDFGPAERPVDIVFCHANGFNARTYRTLLAPLAAGLRILAPDLRGHGSSTLPAGREDWQGWGSFAADLLALLAIATDRPVVLAGHSLGATASLLAAGQAPARVRALVLFEPVLLARSAIAAPSWETPLVQGALRRRETFPSHAAAFAAYQGRGAFAGWSDDQLADYVAAGFRHTATGEVTLACPPIWEALTYAVHDYDAEAFAQLQCPVRVLAADAHSTFAPEVRAFAARHGVDVKVVPQTSHFLPMERPDLARQALSAAARGA